MNDTNTALLLVLIQGVGFALVAVAFFFIALFLKGLIDKLIALVENLNEKVTSIDDELKPIMSSIDQSLKNIEPFTRELGERGEEVGRLIENLERVTDDARATTGAIRGGVVPIAHTLKGLFAGLMEGAKVLGEYQRSGKDEIEIE